MIAVDDGAAWGQDLVRDREREGTEGTEGTVQQALLRYPLTWVTRPYRGVKLRGRALVRVGVAGRLTRCAMSHKLQATKAEYHASRR